LPPVPYTNPAGWAGVTGTSKHAPHSGDLLDAGGHGVRVEWSASVWSAHKTSQSYRDFTAKLGLLGFDAAIPESVRSMAESGVAQTRQATNRSMDALETSVATFEKSFNAAGQGAIAFNRKFIDLARRNLNSSFDPGCRRRE
jgi:hypothetical protein